MFNSTPVFDVPQPPKGEPKEESHEYPKPRIRYFYTYGIGNPNGREFRYDHFHTLKELVDYLWDKPLDKRHEYKIGVEIY